MLAFLLLLIIIVSVLYVLFSKKYGYWEARGVPFPKPTFIFGNVWGAIILRTTLSKIFCKFYRDFKGYAYVGFFNLWNPALVIRDPELVKDVLIKQFSNFHDNWIVTEPEVDPVFSDNPFVLQGDRWKLVRAQLTPQFTSSKIKSMMKQILLGCKNMVEYIKKETSENGSNILEVRDLAVRYTGDNVIRCAYGLDGRSFLVKVPDSFKVGEQISSSNKFVQVKQTLSLFSGAFRRLFKATFFGDPVPQMFKDIILEAIKYREENNVVRNDYLDFIKDLKNKPSEIKVDNNYLVAHAFTFFMDGYETSGLTFAYAMFELSMNSDVQNKARKAISGVLEKHGGELTYEAFQEMEYIENIIFETLRKHPIIKFISRVCTEEMKFPAADGSEGQVTIEKGTEIFIPVEAIHTDPDYYPEPDQFNPDRFNEEAKNLRPKCSFLGFGDGPRICLGRRFALAQVKLGLITILSEFDLKLGTNTVLPLKQENLHIFNSPKTQIMLEFHPRSE